MQCCRLVPLLEAVRDLLCPCTGERLAVVEMQCERLRMLYRDCARPPPPPLQADRRQVRHWCLPTGCDSAAEERQAERGMTLERAPGAACTLSGVSF